MIKHCPYFNYSLDAQVPFIGCKNSLDARQIRFVNKEERDDWYNNLCNCDFTKCRYYKTFRAREIDEERNNEKLWNFKKS